MHRFAVVVCLLLSCAVPSARAQTPASAPLEVPLMFAPGHPDRFARAGAWVGLVGSALLLSGSVALTMVDDPGRERVTRSVHLGMTAGLAPFVALAGWTARRRTKVEGYEAARALGWAAYSGAIALGVSQLYSSFNDMHTSRGLTMVGGALAVLSVLPQAFDSYVCARQARLAGMRLVVTPLGVAGSF